MGRPKKSAPPVEPEDESQDIAELEAQEPDEDQMPEGDERPKVSKTDAIRAALAEGAESPDDGTDFIRKRFGMEISKSHFSATKSQIKKKDAAAAPKGKRAPKAEKAPEQEPARVPTPRPKAAPVAQPEDTGAEMIEDLEAVKSLVKKLGAEQVRRIVGLFED
jgi:hypothetical protein